MISKEILDGCQLLQEKLKLNNDGHSVGNAGMNDIQMRCRKDNGLYKKIHNEQYGTLDQNIRIIGYQSRELSDYVAIKRKITEKDISKGSIVDGIIDK